ncbi:hypothetical protein K470DRAFT_200019, partial [Piedraia hortae CBS 480.64]
SNISPAVPSPVIYKLLGFSLAMVTLPIASYFLTVNSLFQAGNSTWAGALAAVMANVVLVAYIVVAFRENAAEAIEKSR